MYTEYFNKKMDEILKPFDCLPYVKAFIYYSSYERGHSAGKEEMINIAEGLAYELKEALIKDGIIDGNGNLIHATATG